MLAPSQLKALLVEQCGAKVDGESYFLDEERKFGLLLQNGQNPMQLARVKQLTFLGELLSVVTDEEVYYISADCVFGLKSSNPDRDRDEHRPGFRR